MQVTEIKFDQSGKVHLVVEIPETEAFSTRHQPQMPRILFRMFPYLASQRCFNEDGHSFRREAQATEIPHLFEHLVLEIQKQVRRGIFPDHTIKGLTEWNWSIDPRGRFHVVLDYDNEMVALASVRLAERIMNALDSRDIVVIDVDREMRRLRDLAKMTKRFIGPLRNAEMVDVELADAEDASGYEPSIYDQAAESGEPLLDMAKVFLGANV